MHIGIAGYMGAGKTEAARVLARRGFEVIDADAEAKQLMQGDPAIRRQLKAVFGPAMVTNGSVQFGELGRRAFDSPAALAALNRIVHPPLRHYLLACLAARKTAAVVLDAALLPLWDCVELFDALLWVHAPVPQRLRRLRPRTGLDRRTLAARMALQEHLLTEPPSPPWVRVSNRYSPAALERRLLRALGTAARLRACRAVRP